MRGIHAYSTLVRNEDQRYECDETRNDHIDNTNFGLKIVCAYTYILGSLFRKDIYRLLTLIPTKHILCSSTTIFTLLGLNNNPKMMHRIWLSVLI